jgi:hypothetical protein
MMNNTSKPPSLLMGFIRNSLLLWLLVVGLAYALSGCTRVPGKTMPKLSVSKKSNAKAVARVAVVAAESYDFEDGFEDEEAMLDDIASLCTDACEHWAALRFPVPKTKKLIRAGAHKSMQRIFSLQRRQYAQICESACVTADNRARAQCILLAEQRNEIDRCLRL